MKIRALNSFRRRALVLLAGVVAFAAAQSQAWARETRPSAAVGGTSARSVEGFQASDSAANRALVWRATPESREAFVCPILMQGRASYYHPRFEGRPTASGEPYNSRLRTAAINNLSLMRKNVCVVHLRTGAKQIVRVNDTGQLFGRLADLSLSTARDLGMVTAGVAPIAVTAPECCSRQRQWYAQAAKGPVEIAETPEPRQPRASQR